MRPLPLRTRSLTLRRFVPEDAAALLRLNGEESTRRWLPSHVYADLAQAEAAVAYLIECYSTPGDPRRGPYVLGVELHGTGELLGHVGFSPLGDEVEVSFAIAEGARGRGYGAEALEAGCAWVSGAFALPRVVAVTDATNRASRRLLDRTGFSFRGDGIMRFQGTQTRVTHHVWSGPSADADGA